MKKFERYQGQSLWQVQSPQTDQVIVLKKKQVSHYETPSVSGLTYSMSVSE